MRTSTKLVCLASRTVTTAWTSSISFCFSSSSKCMYHLAKRVLPARFWIKINRIYNNNKNHFVIHKFCKYHHVIVPANKLLQMSVQETSFMLVACKDWNLPMMLQLTGCKEQRWKGYWTPDIRWKLSQLLQLMVDLFYRGKSSFARPLPVVRGSYCSRLFLQNSFSFLRKLGKCRFISRNYNYFSLLRCVVNF